MPSIVMYLSALCGVGLIIYMLIKNLDIKISLFFVGIVLMYIALGFDNPIAIKKFTSSGVVLLDPLKAIVEKFKNVISTSGFIILILGGYSTYMSAIKANDATVSLLTKPLKYIKSAYILVPAVFLIGNLLSLVVPSASNLAIIMLATMYPIMKKAGLSTLSTAGIIATTATIMPTPLGSDNVAVAKELSTLSNYAGLTVSEYVFNYHARASIPTLLFMAVVHLFWQKFCDKRDGNKYADNTQNKDIEELGLSPLARIVYAFLPLLPIILLIGIYFFSDSGDIGIEIIALFSFAVAIICEIVRTRDFKSTLNKTQSFFKGMGDSMPIVGLLVAGTTFVLGIQSLGIISVLQESMTGMQANGFGFVLPLALVLLTALIVILSGSGIALFFAMIPFFAPLAEAANLDVMAVVVPSGLAGNLLRAVSPVSAVVMIVAGTIGVTPLEVVKRTSVPMIAGTVFMFLLCMFFYM